jgi:anti-sigma regulatory factor (Ser/Thr protein kinase)
MPLKITADLGQLSRIREYVTESAATLGVSPGVFDDLRLAVDEAVTNIITHGYRGPGDIELTLTAEGADLIVRLIDQAQPFDPTSIPNIDPGSPEERVEPGGFGLYLIRSAMDEIAYSTGETGNELTLIKRDVVGDSGG